MLRNTRRRAVGLVLAAVLLFVAPGAFAAGTIETAATEAPRQVSVGIFDRGLVPSEEGSYESNRWVDWINEQTGLEVTWVPVPRWTAFDAYNVMFASGSAPDLIMEYVRPRFETWRDQGVIQPIDEYIERYSVDYKAYLERHPDILPWTTFDDGQQYFVTSRRFSTANHAAWIRQDWLDNLGLAMPTTTDELLEVARAFTNNDPNRSGRNDTIGITSRVGLFEQMFFVSERFYVEDGRLAPAVLTDRYKSLLDYRKTMFDEGLIDREYVTDTDQQRARRLWKTGQAGIYFAQTLPTFYEELMANDPGAVVVPLEVVEGPYGQNGWLKEPEYNDHKVAFNARMQDPQAAIILIDFLIGGGFAPTRFGFEGVHHEVVDGVRVITDNEKFRREVFYASIDMAFVKDYEITPAYIIAAAGDDPVARAKAQMEAAAVERSMSVNYRRDYPFLPTNETLSLFFAEFDPRLSEIITQAITGGAAMSPERATGLIREEWNRRGGGEVERIMNDWFDANRALLGF